MSIYVGTSKLPGRTFGKKQYMSNVLAGRQLIALFNHIEAKYGWRPTVNEADRSRPDQLFMYDQMVNHGGALAAYPFQSTHDPENYGDADDIGGPNGDALTVVEHNIIVNEGAAYGVFWTGRTFSRPEWWHFNVFPASAVIKAPADTAILTPASGIITPLLSGDSTMKTIKLTNGAVFSVAVGHLVHHASTKNAKIVEAALDDGTIKTVNVGSAKVIFEALSIPTRWTDAKLFVKENGSHVYDRQSRNQSTLSDLVKLVGKK